LFFLFGKENNYKYLTFLVNNYKTMMEGLPVDTSDLPQDSLQNFDAVVQNTLVRIFQGSYMPKTPDFKAWVNQDYSGDC